MARSTGECSVAGCGRVEVLRRGWCMKHYQRWRLNGDPTAITRRERGFRPTPPMLCATCGANFTPSPARDSWTQYCSKTCARKAEFRAGKMGHLVEANRARLLDPSLTDEERRSRKGELSRRARRARLANVKRDSYTTEEIAIRDGWTCWLCGGDVDPSLSWPDMRSASIDHVIPISLGGDDTKRNVRLAHLGENITRGNRIGWRPSVVAV